MRKRAVLIAAAVAGIYAGFGAAVFREAILRTDYTDGNYDPSKPPELLLESGRTPYRRLSREGNIWWNSQPLERMELVSDDGLALVGNLLRADAPEGALALVVHGHRCVSGEMGFIARMYHERGYDVFMADQRAHGKSAGRYIGMGPWECRDMLGWLRLALARTGDKTAVLHGISMGAATAVMMSARGELPGQVVCAIEDAGYTDAYGAIEHVVRRRNSWLPFKCIPMRIASCTNRAVNGYGFKDASALAAARRARVPVMFIHGEADTTVPTYMGRELFAACSSAKELLTVPGAQHGVSYFTDEGGYERRVFDFIARSGGRSGEPPRGAPG